MNNEMLGVIKDIKIGDRNLTLDFETLGFSRRLMKFDIDPIKWEEVIKKNPVLITEIFWCSITNEDRDHYKNDIEHFADLITPIVLQSFAEKVDTKRKAIEIKIKENESGVKKKTKLIATKK